MNKLFMTCLLFGMVAMPLNKGDVLIQDSLIPNQGQVRDAFGVLKGTVKQDSLSPNRYFIEDNRGRRVRTLERDLLNPKQWRVK